MVKRSADEELYASAKKRAEEHDRGWEPTAITLPEGTKLFKFKKVGRHRIDVMPFRAGEGNPYADPGKVYYERTYFIHDGIGINNAKYTCPRKTFGKPCPICEHRAYLQAHSGNEDLIKSLRERERQLFVFRDLDNPDEGYQIYECAHYKAFGEMLDAKVKNADEDDGYENFFHLKGGMTLKIDVEEDSFTNKGQTVKFFKPANIEMKPRPDLPKSVLDEVPCLDELPKEIGYDELKAIFLQKDVSGDEDEDEEEEDTPRRNGKAHASHDDDEDDEDEEDEDEGEEEDSADFKVGQEVEHEDFGVCSVVKVLPNGRLRLEDEDGNLHDKVDPDDVTESEEKPKKKTAAKAEVTQVKKGGKKAPPPEEEEEEEEDEPLDEEEDEGEEEGWGDDEDEEEDSSEEEDEEEDEPPAKKPGKKPAPPTKKGRR